MANSPQLRYDIQAELYPNTKQVRGTVYITYRNESQDPLNEIQFHLYLNAFANEQSTFMRESGGEHRGFSATNAQRWGYLRIPKIRLDGSLNNVRNRLQFIQPDDGNPFDKTVARLPLDHPLLPQQSLQITMDFVAQLPQIFARTGWEEKGNGNVFFMIAQWFPKLGVYERPGDRYIPATATKGAWNTHQFHANSEFYANYASYNVHLTVPSSYKIGATGILKNQKKTGNKTQYHFLATKVHDFAWTADQDFIEHFREWKHVKIRLLLQPEHSTQADRHFIPAQAALGQFEQWFGQYPYTTLTLVDAVGGANGMEYPTLITCGTFYKLPWWLRAVEMVTIHEFGHQYFYGLLGSNEFEESWLDEGFTSYAEMKSLDALYGKNGMLALPNFPISGSDMQRLSYIHNTTPCTIFKKSWEMEDYGTCSYNKPAIVLKTLAHYIGEAQMQKVMRTYFEQWKFKHPTTRDFQDVVETVTQKDSDWFFKQFVYDKVDFDYQISHLSKHRVEIKRQGAGWFPQQLRIQFADGSTQWRYLDGKSRDYQFSTQKVIRSVALDPKDLVWLDLNPWNNRKDLTSDERYAQTWRRHVQVWIQQLLHLF